jgi:hypothetical protein
VPERAYTDAELDAAIEQLTDPERMREGQDLVMRTAPSLQRVLASAIAEGGWLGTAQQAVTEAVSGDDPEQRLMAVRTLMADETRLGMLVGVAVGFELARILDADGDDAPADDTERED